MRMIDGMQLIGDKWVYFLDGRKVAEAKYRERYPLPQSRAGDIVGGTPCKGWPMKSLALAVHPDQVHEANERNRKHGVNVEYDRETGAAIVPDSTARKKLLRLENYRDRDGFMR